MQKINFDPFKLIVFNFFALVAALGIYIDLILASNESFVVKFLFLILSLISLGLSVSIILKRKYLAGVTMLILGLMMTFAACLFIFPSNWSVGFN